MPNRVLDILAWIDGSCFIWDMELIEPERFSARHQSLLRAHMRINKALADEATVA